MIIDRVFTPSLAQVAYLVADEASREVAVIDPRRDTDAYLEWAAERDYQITAVLETHVHADFVSGAPELAAATGAPVYSSRLGNQEFAHTPLDDGDEVRIGDLTLRALFTPGHTPEHLSYLLIDPATGPVPVALFSGDSLFVGDVGRPDLLGDSHTQDLASQLYTTVSEQLATLPDRVTVYPGHTAGSSCGKKIGDAPTTTIGAEKQNNYAFRPKTEAEFVSTVLSGMPLAPTYYPELKKVNKVGASSVDTLGSGAELSPRQVSVEAEAGAMIVDARLYQTFGAAHVPGSVAVGFGPNFLTWIGWLAPYDRDLILVLDDPGQYAEALMELRRIGIDRVKGFLDGGLDAWVAAELPVDSLPQMTTSELRDRLSGSGPAPRILDVRGQDEWDSGHIDGAAHLFAGQIAQGAEAPFQKDDAIIVICGTGYRSSLVSSILQQRGYSAVTNVVGGMTAWNEANYPVVS